MESKKIDDSILSCQKGFTLIELLVVMVIIGMLASLVGPRVFKRLEKAKFQGAEGQRHLLEMALDTYRLDVGRYPTDITGLIRDDTGGDGKWDGPYLKKNEIPKDPWGGDWTYTYNESDDDYDLRHSKSQDLEEEPVATRILIPPGESSVKIIESFNAVHS